MKTTFISTIALGFAVVMAGPADRALAGEPMVLTDAQLDQVTAAGRAEGILRTPIARGPTLIIFDEDTTGGPLVESVVLSFEFIDPGPAPVLPFEKFTLERNETDRLPRYTPQWTDFNTHDPGQR